MFNVRGPPKALISYPLLCEIEIRFQDHVNIRRRCDVHVTEYMSLKEALVMANMLEHSWICAEMLNGSLRV